MTKCFTTIMHMVNAPITMTLLSCNIPESDIVYPNPNIISGCYLDIADLSTAILLSLFCVAAFDHYNLV